jgi:hypothetical protein
MSTQHQQLVGGKYDGIEIIGQVSVMRVEVPYFAPHEKGDWKTACYERETGSTFKFVETRLFASAEMNSDGTLALPNGVKP